MKKRLLFASLFLISILFVSSCAQMSPEDPRYIKDPFGPNYYLGVTDGIMVGPDVTIRLVDPNGKNPLDIVVGSVYPDGIFIEKDDAGELLGNEALHGLCCANKPARASAISQDGDNIIITCSGSSCGSNIEK